MLLNAKWVVTVDERRARLFACRRTPLGSWHVDETGSIQSRWEDYHQHHRPYALDHRPTGQGAEHFASGFSEKEEQEEGRRFARDVRHWLEKAMRESSIDRVAIFCASRFLAPLRHELADLHGHVDLHDAELTRLTPAALATHAAVTGVLEAQTAGQRRR